MLKILKIFQISKYIQLMKSKNPIHFYKPEIYRNFCTSDITSSNVNDVSEANDLEDESLNYDFFDPKYIYSTTNDFSKFVNKMKCKGCGINLQIENQEKIGYIPAKKFFDHLNKKEDANSLENKEPNEAPTINEFEKIHDKATLKRISKLKNDNNKSLICERCYKLTNYLNFEELNKENKNDKAKEKVDNYTSLVKKINPQRLIHQIMTRISSKAHVFYVCDISDLESTINKSILTEIKKRGIRLTFIINKYDTLPTKAVEERIRIWTGETLKEITKDIEGLYYSYILVSSKNGFGFDYVIHKIKTIKERAKEEKTLKPKIYVVGNTNVGKSTFINKLIERSNKFMRENLKYKKNYSITEKTMYETEKEVNSPHREKKNNPVNFSEENNSENDNSIPTKNKLYDYEDNEPREVSNLTSSPLPGTTIGITKIESMRMGIKLFDTPGIPNKNSISFYMNNYIDIISTTINQKIIPFTSSVKQGYSIWIGAIARIDFMNGEDKYFSFFFSNNVTIHRTPLLNAEAIFEKHAGNLLRPAITTNIEELKLQKHTFNLKCDLFSLLNYDILISGLGWFSVSGKGFVQMDLHLPEGVKVYLRQKPIMPYEIKSRGVKKFFGKTVNAGSKINRKVRYKIEASKENKDRKTPNINIK